jgi:nuclear pore complex protein Nup88
MLSLIHIWSKANAYASLDDSLTL